MPCSSIRSLIRPCANLRAPGKARFTGPVAGLLFSGVLLLIGACATNPVSGQKEFVLMSESQEISLGRRSHAEILKEYGRYEDPAVQAYVQRIGEEMAAHGDRQDLIYRFTVLDSEDVNAFALPGGYVYITRGLLAYLNTESDLAAVLGHEIGHVTARHAVRQYTARQATEIGYALGGILVPGLRTGQARDLFDLLGTAVLKGYGREHELEADRLGALYLARDGRDPRAMVRVLKLLKAQETFERTRAMEEGREPHVYHGLFASHPDNDTRLLRVIDQARAVRVAHPRGEDPNQFLPHLDGLTYGPSARQGVLRGTRFFHRELGFGLKFPAGWRVENRKDRILAHAPQGEAMLQLTLEDLNKRTSPQTFIRQRLGIKDLLDGRPLEVNGLPGYTGFSPVDSPWGRRLGRYAVLFFRNQAYILLSAVKDKQQPRQYNSALLNTLYSFHPLTPREAESAIPLRVRLLKASQGTRYGLLARDSRMPDHAEARIRLLNGDYPQGEPRPGRLLKVVY